MYYEWIQENKRTIFLSVVTALVALTIWGVVTIVTRTGKVSVTISAVPSNATITMNDKKLGSGTHWVTPGTYTVTAQKEGFETITKTAEITSEKKQNAVAFSLAPESDEAKKWAEANPDAYKTNEEYGAIEARANGDYFRKKYPITNVLPYTDPYYKIGYTSENNRDITITIATSSPRYRYFAVEKFRELGFNPTDYRITFTDFKNPLITVEAGKDE